MNVGSGVKQPAGAGRTEHLIYPPTEKNRSDNGSPGNDVTARGGIYLSGRATVATTVTGSCKTAGMYRGTVPWRYRNLAAGDLIRTNVGGDFYPYQEQLATDMNPINPTHVYRFLAVMAWPALGGALGANADAGMELTVGNVVSMNNGATRPGVMFGMVDAANIGLRIRKGFAAPYNLDRQMTPVALLGAAADITNWNIWELRFVSADSRGPAQLKAFINGRQFGAAVDCSAAAGIMPDCYAAGGGFAGFHWHMINTNTGVYDFHTGEQHFIRAASEGDDA